MQAKRHAHSPLFSRDLPPAPRFANTIALILRTPRPVPAQPRHRRQPTPRSATTATSSRGQASSPLQPLARTWRRRARTTADRSRAKTAGNPLANSSVNQPCRTRHYASRSAKMRRRSAASGNGPTPAPMFSRMCATWLVAGMAQVTAGCETMNLSSTCGQPLHPISAAQPGSGMESEPAQALASAIRNERRRIGILVDDSLGFFAPQRLGAGCLGNGILIDRFVFFAASHEILRLK